MCFRLHWQKDKGYEWRIQIFTASNSIDLELTDQQWTATSIPSLILSVPKSVAVFIEASFPETSSTLRMISGNLTTGIKPKLQHQMILE